MTEIQIKNNTYRIKKMNAIEVLALQSQIDFEDIKSTMKCYNTLLERIEVQVKDKWLPVKLENSDTYFPAGLEDDFELVDALMHFILSYLKSVFQKSNESKEKTE